MRMDIVLYCVVLPGSVSRTKAIRDFIINGYYSVLECIVLYCTVLYLSF